MIVLPGRRSAGRLPPGEHQPGKMQRRYAPFFSLVVKRDRIEPLHGHRHPNSGPVSRRSRTAPSSTEKRRARIPAAPPPGPPERRRVRSVIITRIKRNNRARRLEPELSEPANKPDKKSDPTLEFPFRFLLRSEPARRLIRAPKPRQLHRGKPRGWEHPASAVSLRLFRREASYTATTE